MRRKYGLVPALERWSHMVLNRFLYKSYRFFYLSNIMWRRRFTTAGVFVVTVAFISAVLGVDTTRNMIYQIFTFAVPVVLIAMVWSAFFPMECSVKRELPRFITVGEPLLYRIHIDNKTKRFQKGLSIFENPKDPRPTYDELIHAREPGEEDRNAWDRKTLYYRWLWLVRQNQKSRFREHDIPDMPPMGRVHVDAELMPLFRGYMYLNGVTVARNDPFGLFKAFFRVSSQQKILVLPKRYTVPPLNLPGTREYHAGGVALASSVGNSDEFVSLREYRPGDPIRNIHWKSWAKTGELIIREFQDEYFVRHGLILDTFSETLNSEIFEEAVSVATSFVASMQTQESILDLMFVGNQAYCFSSGRGLSHSDKMMEVLACVKTCQNRTIAELTPLIDEYAPLMSGCVCIMLAWDDDRKNVVEKFKGRGIPLQLIVITNDQTRYENVKDEMPENVLLLETGKIQQGLSRVL